MSKLKSAKNFAIISLSFAIIASIISLVGRYLIFNADNVSQFGGVNPPTNVIITSEPISALHILSIILNFAIIIGAVSVIGIIYLKFCRVKNKK